MREDKNINARRYNNRQYNTRYSYESTARDFDVTIAIEEEPRKQLSTSVRKNRDRAVHMNFGYVVFLTAAILVAAFVLVRYISLRSEITRVNEKIETMEADYRSLKLKNDETYERILNRVDLMEVKRIAMQEMGMVFAEEDQIINYKGNDNNFVRQYSVIP